MMANDRDNAVLTQIANAVADLQEQQRAILTILARLAETGEAQTEMLAEILGAARQETGPSEAATQLAALVTAVQENSQAVEAMAEQIGSLPAEIGAEIANALAEDAKSEKP